MMTINSFGKSRLKLCAVLILACIYWIMAVTAARNNSATYDEPAHIACGIGCLHNDYRLLIANGQLAQRLAAFPYLFMHPVFPSVDDKVWLDSEQYSVGDSFLFKCGNDAQRLLLAGHMMIALLGVALALLVYVCSNPWQTCSRPSPTLARL